MANAGVLRGLLGEDEREQMVAVAAYYRAERRGFGAGDPLVDWLEAEAEIDRLLAQVEEAPGTEGMPDVAGQAATGQAATGQAATARAAMRGALDPQSQSAASSAATGKSAVTGQEQRAGEMVEERHQYEERVAADLRHLASVLESLRVKAEVVGGRARDEMERALEHLSEREANARSRLEALRAGSQEAWRDLRDGAERAWNDFRQAIEAARQRFR